MQLRRQSVVLIECSAGVGRGCWSRIQQDSEGLGFAIGGADVRAYVLFVFDQLRRRSVRLPSDEEIAATHQKMSPADVVFAAAQATGLLHRKERIGGASGPPRVVVQSPTGCPFQVFVSGATF